MIARRDSGASLLPSIGTFTSGDGEVHNRSGIHNGMSRADVNAASMDYLGLLARASVTMNSVPPGTGYRIGKVCLSSLSFFGSLGELFRSA